MYFLKTQQRNKPKLALVFIKQTFKMHTVFSCAEAHILPGSNFVILF